MKTHLQSHFKLMATSSLLALSINSAIAAESATLSINGSIAPSTCDVSFDSATVDFEHRHVNSLHISDTTAVPYKGVNLKILCDASTRFSVEMRDGQPVASTTTQWKVTRPAMRDGSSPTDITDTEHHRFSLSAHSSKHGAAASAGGYVVTVGTPSVTNPRQWNGATMIAVDPADIHIRKGSAKNSLDEEFREVITSFHPTPYFGTGAASNDGSSDTKYIIYGDEFNFPIYISPSLESSTTIKQDFGSEVIYYTGTATFTIHYI